MADHAIPHSDSGELDRIAELEAQIQRWRVVGSLTASLLLSAWGKSDRFLTDADRSLIARLRDEELKPEDGG